MRKEIITLTLDYVGAEPLRDLLLERKLALSLLGEEEKPGVYKIGEEPSLDVTTFINTADHSPGQTVRVGQTGYDLAVFQWRYNGSPAGHVHGGNYNGGVPQEARFKSGEYSTFTLGPACGMINETITVYQGGTRAREGGRLA